MARQTRPAADNTNRGMAPVDELRLSDVELEQLRAIVATEQGMFETLKTAMLVHEQWAENHTRIRKEFWRRVSQRLGDRWPKNLMSADLETGALREPDPREAFDQFLTTTMRRSAP